MAQINICLFCCVMTERGDEHAAYIPGLLPTRIADFPALLHSKNPILDRTIEVFSWVPRAQYLVMASVYELEARVVEALKSIISFPIYAVGPLLPYFKLGDRSSVTTASDDLHYFRWLDSQPYGSVLYISFGSVVSVTSAQMDEIAAGLRDSGVGFLWVARGENSRLREMCGEKGLVVPWCNQLKVLSYYSVGGFWSHCGWNSTIEGLFSGLRFLTFPVALDQVPNSKAIVEDWKIGWRVSGDGVGAGGTLVMREEIARIVKRFMDSGSLEVKEMKKRARKVQEICRRAAAEGGSVESGINALIRNITQLPSRQILASKSVKHYEKDTLHLDHTKSRCNNN